MNCDCKCECVTDYGMDCVRDRQIRVKKLHPDAVLPAAATKTDAGYDLVAIDDGEVTDTYVQYKTGIAIEPPKGYHTEIFPRSSVTKTDLVLANSVGLVDNAYRGEILVRFKIIGPRVREEKAKVGDRDVYYREQLDPVRYKKGDRIAQLVVRKTNHLEFVWADELSETQRGTGGFGSTGS